jgi:photosystem II stability/assembly factor-like uncharacterized protein
MNRHGWFLLAAAAAFCGLVPAGHARGAVGVIGEHGPFGGVVQAVAVNPDDPNVMYAGTRAGLFTTADGGVSWRRLSAGLIGDWVTSVAVDPTNGQVVWVQDGSHLHKSEDGGSHWTDVTPAVDNWGGRISIAPSDPQTVWSGAARTTDGGAHWARTRTDQTDGVVVDPTHAGTVLITTVNGLFRTTDDGASWSPAGTGLPVWSEISGDAGNGLVVFGINGGTGTVYRSTDGGASFSPISVNNSWQVTGLYAAPSNPLVVYAAGRDGRDPLLARSTDGGVTWARLSTGPVGAILAPFAAVDATDPQHVLVGTFGYGVWVTADGGSSWTARSTGLAATEPRSIATDPLDGSVLYSADGSTVAVSGDGGSTWSDVTTELYDQADPAAGVSPISVAVDGASTAYASRIAVSTPAQWDPVMRSTDHGATWEPASNGIPAGLVVRQLAADRSRQGVVFAAAGSSYFGPSGDVYLTMDSGESWHAVGPAGGLPTAMAFEPESGTLVITAGRKVWTTTDDGAHWKARASLPSGFASDAAATGPTPATLYVADNSSSRVAYSRDEGDSWSIAVLDHSNNASSTLAVAVDPGDPGSIWAGTEDGGLFFSRDAGVSWTQLNPGAENRTVAAIATTDDTGLATDRVHPLFIGRYGNHSNGVARLIPAPRNLRRPTIRGTVEVGSAVTCARGSWRNAVAFTVRWYRDGATLASRRTIRVVQWADRGHHLSCAVTASGPGGHRTARSRERMAVS